MTLSWDKLHSIPGKPWWQAAQLLPWLSLCLLAAAWCCTLCFCFPLSSFSTGTLSRGWEKVPVNDGPVHWSLPHGGPRSCPACLTSGWDFWDCFLTWPGVQWEPFYLNAKTFRSQKEGKLPSETRCDSCWPPTWVLSEDRFALFGQPGPSHCGMVWWQSAHVPLHHHQHWALLPVARERQWEEQQEASSALTFNLAMQGSRKRGMMRWPAVLCGREHLFQLSMSLLCAKYQESQYALPNIPLMST